MLTPLPRWKWNPYSVWDSVTAGWETRKFSSIEAIPLGNEDGCLRGKKKPQRLRWPGLGIRCWHENWLHFILENCISFCLSINWAKPWSNVFQNGPLFRSHLNPLTHLLSVTTFQACKAFVLGLYWRSICEFNRFTKMIHRFQSRIDSVGQVFFF